MKCEECKAPIRGLPTQGHGKPKVCKKCALKAYRKKGEQIRAESKILKQLRASYE